MWWTDDKRAMVTNKNDGQRVIPANSLKKDQVGILTSKKGEWSRGMISHSH